MLIRFKSTATETVTMFADTAVPLIQMMGASGAVPGAISAADIPDAIAKLRSHLKNSVSAATAQDQDDDKDREPIVALATRAVPLIQILERAAASDAPVMWERA